MRHVSFATTLTLAAAAATACNDFATPAELSHPQVLALRAEPPAVPAGERAALSLLVAGPDGDVTPAAIDWAVIGVGEDLPTVGAIEIDGDGAVFFAAPQDTDGVTLAVVQATIHIDDAKPLTAVKGIGAGVLSATANPTILGLRIGGEPVADGGVITLTRGATVSLELDVDPLPGQDSIFSWYATRGEIELYRRSPTELVTPEEPGEGWLYAVYRDGAGGTAWRRVGLLVE
jgi:hypothetical protein